MYTIIATIVCIFAVYGVVRFALSALYRLNPQTKTLNDFRHQVVFFKNNQDDAEIKIRSLIWDASLSDKSGKNAVIAVDFGSVDETYTILKKLEKEYNNFSAVTSDEYIKLIKEYGI